jgi:hypothetical protein
MLSSQASRACESSPSRGCLQSSAPPDPRCGWADRHSHGTCRSCSTDPNAGSTSSKGRGCSPGSAVADGADGKEPRVVDERRVAVSNATDTCCGLRRLDASSVTPTGKGDTGGRWHESVARGGRRLGRRLGESDIGPSWRGVMVGSVDEGSRTTRGETVSLPQTTGGYGLGPGEGESLWFNGALGLVKASGERPPNEWALRRRGIPGAERIPFTTPHPPSGGRVFRGPLRRGPRQA